MEAISSRIIWRTFSSVSPKRTHSYSAERNMPAWIVLKLTWSVGSPARNKNGELHGYRVRATNATSGTGSWREAFQETNGQFLCWFSVQLKIWNRLYVASGHISRLSQSCCGLFSISMARSRPHLTKCVFTMDSIAIGLSHPCSRWTCLTPQPAWLSSRSPTTLATASVILVTYCSYACQPFGMKFWPFCSIEIMWAQTILCQVWYGGRRIFPSTSWSTIAKARRCRLCGSARHAKVWLSYDLLSFDRDLTYQNFFVSSVLWCLILFSRRCLEPLRFD